MRSALIYNPGLHVLGGGERYTFAIAKVLRESHDVTVAGPVLPDRGSLERLGFPLDVPLAQMPITAMTAASQGIDVLVDVVTTPPYRSRARHSYLVVQFPFGRLPGLRHPRAWLRRRHLAHYQCIVYSEFTRAWLNRRWGVDSAIIPPAVQLGTYDRPRKERLIVGLGRFYPRDHDKRHDVLIDAYRKLPDNVRRQWRLVLAGGARLDAPGAERFFHELRQSAVGLDVEFRVNVPQPELNDLLTRASVFWHAAGYGRPDEEPEQAEHFGIATVEAMSHGAVPIVYADGGQPEIVIEGTGHTFQSIDELAALTTALASSPDELGRLATAAVARSCAYGYERFARQMRALVEEHDDAGS